MDEQSGGAGRNGKPARTGGFRRAGALISEQTRAATARRGYLEARLRVLWPDVAGPEIASVTRPLRLAPTRGPSGGLLTLGVSGANGPQIQMLLPLIRERVNAALGPGVVGRVQLRQTGFAEEPAPFAPPAPAPDPPPDLGPTADALSSIGDPDLRAALETLARNVLIRAGKDGRRGAATEE